MSEGRRWGPLHPEGEDGERLAKTALGRDEQWRIYRFMVLNRRVEDRLSNLYRRGKIVGGAYSSRGQEGVSVGSASALTAGDLIGPLIRNLGAQLVRGIEPRQVFAQHMGRVMGKHRGKDNLPPTDLGKGLVGPIAMLGSLLSVVGGALLARRQQGKPTVGLTWIGDGATSTGEFHEGINLAAVLNLPLVVIAEHNGYAYSTPTTRQMRIKDIALKAVGYGIPGETIDGNDVLAVYETTRRAVERARAGGGPTLIEVKTFRMKGHAEHDDASYVPAELRRHWEEKDPLLRFERHLVGAGMATSADFEALAVEIERTLDEDVEAALAAPLPPAEEAGEGIYATAVEVA